MKRGSEIFCKGWHQEAVLRMLMIDLDPQVAEIPEVPEGVSSKIWE